MNPIESDPAPQRSLSPRERPVVLVVDDQPINIRVLYQALSPDYQVLQATDGLRALEICRESHPDLILLDIVIPDLDGYEVCTRLKADPATRQIPVIFVTSRDSPEDETRGLDIGAVDFIAKPITPAVVRRRVRTHLELARSNAVLADLNASLELRILERTHDLELARRQADQANRAKGEFLSNMSHEIRTPMNSIIGLSYLALRARPEPKVRDYLDKISQSGRHLLGIISDILDLSKLEVGKLELETRDFTVGETLRTVEDQLGESAQAKGLVLECTQEPVLSLPLRGDPLRIGQVLLNLVGNAIKFSTKGSICVHAQRLQSRHEGCSLRIEVRDEGIGMEAGQVERLFQPFQQLDASTTRRYGGTGLGLAISKQLIDLMGGRIGVQSEPGVGSTFWFELDLAWSQNALAPRKNSGEDVSDWSREATAEERSALAGRTLLVVDDNLLNQQVATELLEEVGVNVRVANDGREALERLSEGPVDAILMDMQMPVMDGLQATREIRTRPGWARIPIIAMTANAREEDRMECLNAGMNDFLTKPVMAHHLFEVVMRWMPQRGESPPPPAAPRPARVVAPAETLAGDPEIIDLSQLALTLNGRIEAVHRVARMFVDTSRQGLRELDIALAREDLGELATLGHRMKSSASAVGALGFARRCTQLERLRREGSLEDARTLVGELHPLSEAIAAHVQQALEARREA